jgi:colanic acid biosynthesis glycosyl transferase WcaI
LARVLIHSLVFTPDGVSNAYLYRDLALELHRHGHQVTVLTTIPHYNVIQEELAKQPMMKRWGGLYATSTLGGDVRVIHILMFKKSPKHVGRVISALWFHIAAVVIGAVVPGHQDVVFASSPPLSTGFIGRLLAWLWGAPSVYIVQDVFPDGLVRQGKIRSKMLIVFLQKLEKLVYNTNDAVIVIAHSFVPTIRPRVRNSAKLHLIENFVDTEFYRPLPRHNEFSQKHGLDGFFVVSYVGNIGNAQDFSPVVKAAKELKDLPIKFVFIGNGILRQSLERQISDQKLENISVLGYMPRDVTPWANASSDISMVLLSPHIKGDGFPSKIFSIMACGRTAIITADEGSDLTRVVRESGCGRVVPVGDAAAFVAAVRRAYEEREMLAVEGLGARDYVVRNYSKEAISAHYNQLIQELYSEKKRSKSR